jgi:hypothetical protein
MMQTRQSAARSQKSHHRDQQWLLAAQLSCSFGIEREYPDRRRITVTAAVQLATGRVSSRKTEQ